MLSPFGFLGRPVVQLQSRGVRISSHTLTPTRLFANATSAVGLIPKRIVGTRRFDGLTTRDITVSRHTMAKFKSLMKLPRRSVHTRSTPPYISPYVITLVLEEDKFDGVSETVLIGLTSFLLAGFTDTGVLGFVGFTFVTTMVWTTLLGIMKLRVPCRALTVYQPKQVLVLPNKYTYTYPK